ncbi:hypothetical protein VTK73DRAFT_5741 [Phialemonium thermophilum]|uniref:Chromosome segregation in meiosis protein n=1 Tax=Phialemonium thermophilum TaxID=223376 RepID=A0ABR3WMH1_9PEZI
MPAKTSSKPSGPAEPSLEDLEGYLLPDDFQDDVLFGSSKADAGKSGRKDDGGLGIDEEVEVKKRVREPRVKLDESRLLSEKGIPELRKRAKRLKFKGKGHEFSDAARLLSLYQLWLDDLFPKAKFLDALAMVEKEGHKTTMRKNRLDWIDESKPKPASYDDEPPPDEVPREQTTEPTRIAPLFEKSGTRSERPSTPALLDDDLFGGAGIYDATPRRTRGGEKAQDVPDEDLDALVAANTSISSAPRPNQAVSTAKVSNSIFGGGEGPGLLAPALADGEQEDLDALLAESEGQAAAERGAKASEAVPKQAAEEEDDLDALMAEAELQGEGPPVASRSQEVAKTGPSADEEEAMAEMDGLW